MKLIDVLLIGKENKQTREELMYKAKIMDVKTFKEEMGKIILPFFILISFDMLC